MPISIYEIAWIFLIYAFLGWCCEVAYAALNTGKFVNRGFLNGPVCPVYGCGVLVVVLVLTPLKENLFILFVGSLLLTSAIEFVTGFLLEKLFHNQWWDYSDQPFNLCGYICLKFSILWGLACTFVMDIVHPMIAKAIKIFPHIPGWILLALCAAAFACDLGITVSTILKFNRCLKMMHEVGDRLHKISDEIGENIYENVTTAMERSEELKEKSEKFLEEHEDIFDKAKIRESQEEIHNRIQEKKKAISEKRAEYNEKRAQRQWEIEELSRKYKELLEKQSFGFRRLIKAFPNMISRDNNEMLQKYKNHHIRRTKRGKSNERDEK